MIVANKCTSTMLKGLYNYSVVTNVEISVISYLLFIFSYKIVSAILNMQ